MQRSRNVPGHSMEPAVRRRLDKFFTSSVQWILIILSRFRAIRPLIQKNNFFSGRWDKRDAVWIGLNDIEQENKFTFSDGSPMSYQNWFDKFPNDNFKFSDCTLIPLENDANFKWKDATCGLELPFICRIKLNKLSSQALDDIVTHN